MKKAVGLFSGGLDSVLACKIICDLGFDVRAIYFSNYFQTEKKYNNLPENYFFDVEHGKFSLIEIDTNQQFFKILKNPKHGFGKNLNPCIDCKILFITEAFNLMKKINAEFVFTGEVVGQRPKSQKMNTLNMINNKVESEGYLVRPLCAKLLKPTIPEQTGVLDRNKLLDISGRSRKRQLELAEKLNLRNYGSPAGGCYLTDKIYCKRLDYLIKNNMLTEKHVKYISFGRNFVYKNYRIIIGRNQNDNKNIYENAENTDLLITAENLPGPTGIILNETKISSIPENVINETVNAVVKYTDRINIDKIEVKLFNKTNEYLKNRVLQNNSDFKHNLKMLV